jgi:hypothetical protein
MNLFRTLPSALLCAAAIGLAAAPAAAAPVSYIGGASGFAGGGTLSFSFSGDFTQLGLQPGIQSAGFPVSLGGFNFLSGFSDISVNFTGNSLVQAFSIDGSETRNFFGPPTPVLLDYQAFASGTGTPTLSDNPDMAFGMVDEQTGVQITVVIANDPVFDNFLTTVGVTVRGVELRAPIGPNEFLTDRTNNVFIDPVVGTPEPGNNVPEPQSLALALAGLTACALARRRSA